MNSHPPKGEILASQSFPVYLAQSFRVILGVNEGDSMSCAQDVTLEDHYALSKQAVTSHITLETTNGNKHFNIAKNSESGVAGAPVFLDCIATFMAPSGQTQEAFIFVETDENAEEINEVYLYPLSPFIADLHYSLVSIDTQTAKSRLAESACVSFSAGTHITLADGQQIRVENLRAGDKILTRDNGVQTLRWIGQQTLRATGSLAPIVVSAGTLNNANDLVVSPNHRLFIFQRSDKIGAGKSEILVKAELLINGDTVRQVEGGFIDYFQLLFDEHQIIYAEGIAAESLFADHVNLSVLPEDTDYHERHPYARELSAKDIGNKNAIDLLRDSQKS